MTKILDEVRAISSDAIAKKQDASKNKMPELYKQIKGAAALGKTRCEFPSYQIDEYSKKLLEVDGFQCWATTKTDETYKLGYLSRECVSIWIVSW